MRTILAKLMASGAFVLVGALPLLLWGRFEGFPNFLLAGVCVWAVAWALAGNLKLQPGEEPGWRWGLMGGLLAVKFGATGWGLTTALKRGWISWRFPLVLVAGWTLIALGLGWFLPRWEEQALWNGLTVAIFLPLARFALSPVALAFNRHR